MVKRILKGIVVSDKSDKTIVVEVSRRFVHPNWGHIYSSFHCLNNNQVSLAWQERGLCAKIEMIWNIFAS